MTTPSRIAWVSTFFLVIALFYAPLAYGCTRPEMLPPLYGLLLAFIVTGAIGFFVDKQWPAIPKLAVLCLVAILVQGWWLTWYPTFPSLEYASGGLVDITLENIERLSLNSMIMNSLFLGSFVVLCGLLSQPFLRRFILLAAATSGVLICIIGDALKIAGEPLMRYFWNPLDIYWNDFAFYRYQGNAGAFLNLVWPLILVFTRRAYTPTNRFSRKIFWTIASLACASALFLNASKSALIIGLFILPWPFLTRLMRMTRKHQVLVGAITFLVVVGGLYLATHSVAESAFQRMTSPAEVAQSAGGRAGAYRQYLDALPQVGAFGLGPGLFQLAFPYQISPLGNITAGLREYAHEDYLQTVLEWGWFGTIWWALLVAGGLVQAFRSHARKELFTSKTERHLILAAILGVLGLLVESLVDFPLQIASIRLFFMVLLALCWASPQLLTRPRQDPTTRIRYRLPIPADIADERFTTSSREP